MKKKTKNKFATNFITEFSLTLVPQKLQTFFQTTDKNLYSFILIQTDRSNLPVYKFEWSKDIIPFRSNGKKTFEKSQIRCNNYIINVKSRILFLKQIINIILHQVGQFYIIHNTDSWQSKRLNGVWPFSDCSHTVQIYVCTNLLFCLIEINANLL